MLEKRQRGIPDSPQSVLDFDRNKVKLQMFAGSLIERGLHEPARVILAMVNARGLQSYRYTRATDEKLDFETVLRADLFVAGANEVNTETINRDSTSP